MIRIDDATIEQVKKAAEETSIGSVSGRKMGEKYLVVMATGEIAELLDEIFHVVVRHHDRRRGG